MRPIITINQETDTPARREVTPGAVLTYLYDRSRDSRQHAAPGQDFIAYAYDEQCIVFAVCDGVSQSFYGDLAARFLGERLVTWFRDVFALSPQADAGELAAAVDSALRAWVPEAAALVLGKPLGDHLPPMVRDVLERKRENGSESMFIAGRVDLVARLLAVCWMGDMRLRLWDHAGELIALPGDAWETRERWSTRFGPKNGAPHAAILPLDPIRRITVHSDGIRERDDALRTITLESLDALARELSDVPASDDISILDIALEPAALPHAEPLEAPQPYLPDPREALIRWAPVEGAAWYRVEISGETARTVEVTEPVYLLPPESMTAGPLGVRVQALASDRLPSAWSAPLGIAVLAPVPAQALASEPARPAAVIHEVAGGQEPREFRIRWVMVLALLLAAALAVGWYVVYLAPLVNGP